ncbi:hd domain-containing protein [Ophiostoma piceae UAMH 11346]|uniref:Hd domain-containing protein n=1 Tax=Ophiostoma piceae (strain UAMH 11346) TaxID=1262450 RepID=S3BUT4_OPHP1|nr:hd domain-containing protein [Ophiostoma piceae UAMH 11346]
MATQSDSFSLTGDPLVEAVTAAVRVHMARYDGSHDFNHIRRVVGNARHLTAAFEKEQPETPVDKKVVALAALLHDVGDRKYVADDENKNEGAAILAGTPYEDDKGARATAAVLHKVGGTATPALLELSRRVITVCQNVSWSHETKTPASEAAVAQLAAAMPELAIVQDADRLDAIGAVGIGRCFAFGARPTASAPLGRSLDVTLAHFDEKLLLVGGRMKTAEGRRLAVSRTERMQTLQAWFQEESSFAIGE